MMIPTIPVDLSEFQQGPPSPVLRREQLEFGREEARPPRARPCEAVKVGGSGHLYGTMLGKPQITMEYPLVMTNSLLLKMAIEIGSFPMKPWWFSIVM